MALVAATVCARFPLGIGKCVQEVSKQNFSNSILCRKCIYNQHSQHPDSNRGPTDYKSVALPLCYAGEKDLKP